jgi:hypothetical protein
MILKNESLTKVGTIKEELTFSLSDFIKSEVTNFSRQKIPHNWSHFFSIKKFTQYCYFINIPLNKHYYQNGV